MEKYEVLDLAKMSIRDTKALNKLYTQNAGYYTQLIDKLSAKWGQNIYWWTTHLASRNQFLSGAYKDICMVMLAIKRIQADTRIKTVILPKKTIVDTLENYYKDKRIIEFKYLSDDRNIYVYEKFCKLALHSYNKKKIIDKEMPVSIEMKKNEEIILVNTEILASQVLNDNYNDRLFGNLADYTDAKLVFFPLLMEDVNLKFKKFIKKLSINRKDNTILKEQYLKRQDYFKLFFFPIWCNIFCCGKKNFRGIDVTNIINEDIRQNICSGQSVEGLLNYYAIKRMKKKKLNIKRLIGWYEGQPASLALFKAYHQEYTHGMSIGSIGYAVDSKWLSLIPSKEQVKQKVAPQRIGIPGYIYKNVPQQFCPDVKVVLFPAFRMQKVYSCAKENCESYKGGRNILLSLSYGLKASANILQTVKNIEEWCESYNIKFYIKNHPQNSKMSLNSYGVAELKCNYEFIQGSFDDALNMVDLVITTTSSTSYEAVLSRKRVIMIAERNEILYTYMLPEWEDLFYSVAYDAEELKKEIKLFLSMEPMVLELDDTYLVKADKDVIRNAI